MKPKYLFKSNKGAKNNLLSTIEKMKGGGGCIYLIKLGDSLKVRRYRISLIAILTSILFFIFNNSFSTLFPMMEKVAIASHIRIFASLISLRYNLLKIFLMTMSFISN